MQLEVDLAEPEPAAEIDAAGPALEGVVVGLDGARPVAGPLLVEPAFQNDGGFLRQARRGGRRRTRRPVLPQVARPR